MSSSSNAILRLFHERGGFVSGESLSRELRVSRTAVWKQVNGLRKLGYVIEAIPSRGYFLKSSPDLLTVGEITPRLSASVIGRHIICLDETVSTNSDAFRLAEQGADEGTVVLADRQCGGRGRLGRNWLSPAGVNLYCSVILRPHCLPYEAPQLTFLSAVAVALSIEQSTGLVPRIKWPNDVLIDGKKVAGLLNELSAETDGVNFVVLGIGVNLNMRAGQFGTDLRHPATSIMIESGKRVCRPDFAATMLNELDRLYAEFRVHGFGPVREEWQRRCNAHGREVTVCDGDAETARGTFAGIDDYGALLVRGCDGSVTRILSGDVRVM